VKGKAWFAGLLALSVLPFLQGISMRADELAGIPAADPPIPGDADVYEHSWHFWWTGFALERGMDPRVCELLGDSARVPVVSKNIGWPDAVVFGIAACGRAAAALWMALAGGTALAFVGGWAFARAWGLNGGAAAMAAVMFAWAPARVAHVLQHYQLACAGWAALYLAFLKYWIGGGKMRAIAGVFSCSAIAGLESPYHLLFIGTGAVATLLLSPRTGARRIGAALLATAAGASAAAIFFLTTPGGFPNVALHWSEAIYYSAEPQSFLLPSPFGLAGQLLGVPLMYSWMPNVFEGVATIGLSVMLLAAFSLKSAPRKTMLWAALAFCILGLGPELKFLGRPFGIPLPFRLLQEVPFLSWIRSPTRFSIMASLFASVPAAWVLFSLKRPARALVCAFVLLELYVPRVPSLSGRIPSFYRQAGDPAAGVLEIPASPMILRYSLFQTADSRPRLVYFVPRDVPALAAELRPFSLDSGRAVDSRDAFLTGADLIVYNRWLFGDGERERLDSLYSGLFGRPDPGESLLVWRRP
jgi:hypothetical protein